MAYIGKTPTVGNFQVCDAISVVNGQAAYTLQVGGVNVAPESANHMLVSLNGILQKPGSSFTISGSTMTFASNLATGDVIDFVQILGNVLDLGQPSDDTVTAAKLATTSITGQTAETSAADADTILIHDDSASALRKMTRSNFLSGVGQTNTPYFYARLGSDQSVGYTGLTTKIALDTEILDSASAYDTSSYRFTPQTAGKYFFYGQIYFETTSSSNNYNNLVTLGTIIKKNGSNAAHNYIFRGGQQFACRRRNLGTSVILDMNGSSDYVELYGYSDSHIAGNCNAAADAGGSTFLFGYFVAT